MRNTLAALAFAAMTSFGFAQDVKPTAPPEPAGMIQMFNGKDLTGWSGDMRLWSAKDGVIRGETTKENPTFGNTFQIGRASCRERV